ncbi:MAG: hypothetical protein V7739_15295 [Motiliproteus sp.]
MGKYDERLYGQFQKEKESFHRWVLAALFLGVFYGFVFQPYLTILTNIADLELQQLETDAQIKLTEKEIQTATSAIGRASRFMGDASEFQRLYDNANSWINRIDEIEKAYPLQSRLVARLRDSLSPALQEKWQIGKVPNTDTLKLLKNLRPELMKNFQLKNNCFFRLETDWVACQVRQKRKPINDKLSRVLYDRTMAHEYTALLKVNIESNNDKYNASLSNALSEASLKQWVKEYLGEEQAIIRSWYEHMASERLKLERKSKSYQEAKKKHALTEVMLDKRKKDISQAGKINTPLGPIKLAFHDLLSLVPFLGLFILSLLVRSTCRQLVLRSAFQVNGPEDETTHEALSLTMSIWLEPLKPRIMNVLLLVGLALLATAPLIGLWQVLTNPGLEIAEVKLNYVFIIACTMLASIVFAIFYVRLLANYLLLTKP